MKMEAIYSSETSVECQRTARRYISEDRTLNIHSVRQEFSCLLCNAKFISVLTKARQWTLSRLSRIQSRTHSAVLPNAFKYCQHSYTYIFHVVSFHNVYKLKFSCISHLHTCYMSRSYHST
jgi:hypothetical protein